MFSLVRRGFRFDAETEKASEAWLDGDSRQLLRISMIFGIVAYAINHVGDYWVAGADVESLFVVRLTAVGALVVILGFTYVYRDFSPALAGVLLAVVASTANTAIMHFMPDSAAFWLVAAQTITALIFALIMTRYEALIAVAIILFVAPMSLRAVTAGHSNLELPEAVLLATTVTAMVIMGHFIERGKRTIFKLSRDLLYAATHDTLTGIFNRLRVLEALDHEVTMFERFEQPVAIVCIDIDHFKLINDTYGHLAGDEVLRCMAECITDEIRGSDIVGRTGGEEFLIVLPRTDLAEACDKAERLRHVVEMLAVPWRDQSITCTISCGVAQCRPSDDATSLMARADLALYRAKESGRNRTETRAKLIEPVTSGLAEGELSAAMSAVRSA